MNEKLTEFWLQSKDRSRLNCCRLDFSKTRKDLECNLIQINKMDPGLCAGASLESTMEPPPFCLFTFWFGGRL